MKRLSTIVIVLCTILNIYFFLPIATAYITHKFSLEWVERSAQMGDTFGGLLSPVIGLVSIYFIYETFAAQRKQLSDQVRATNFAGSSLYFSEVSDMISNVKLKLINLEYREYVDIKVGEEAMNTFKEDLSVNNLPDEFLRNGLPLLRSINEQMSRIALISKIGDNIEDMHLKELFKDKFKNELLDLIKQIISVFESVRRSLQLIQNDDEYRQNNRNHVSWLASQYESYLKSIHNLNKLGDVVIKNDSPDRVYTVRIHKITVEERLSGIDISSKWSAK